MTCTASRGSYITNDNEQRSLMSLRKAALVESGLRKSWRTGKDTVEAKLFCLFGWLVVFNLRLIMWFFFLIWNESFVCEVGTLSAYPL